MTRRARFGAALLVAFGALALAPQPARADHCDPIEVPAVGEDRTYCHTPQPTPKPKPTPKPTTTPAATPAPATARPATNTGPRTATGPTTPAPTPFDIEVPDEEPFASAEVLIDGPIGDEVDFNVQAQDTASTGGSLLVGFVVGFIVGGLVGRASWGLRRKRRQQIFG